MRKDNLSVLAIGALFILILLCLLLLRSGGHAPVVLAVIRPSV